MMNISQSLSSLSSWSSSASSTNYNSFLPTTPSTSNSSFSGIPSNSSFSGIPIQQFDQCFTNQMQSFNQFQSQPHSICYYQQQIQPQVPSSLMRNQFIGQSSINSQRPITGTHNFPLKSKPVVPAIQRRSSFFTPSLLSMCPNKYSRKVFVGGLPPDIDQGKF